MVIDVIVNGSPMHYCLMRMCYRPHPGLEEQGDGVFNFAVSEHLNAPIVNYKVVLSQFSGININPCKDATASLRIPYMSPKSGIELGLGEHDMDRLGTLLFFAYAPLRQVNEGTNGVSIEVYARLENVVLDVPTAIAQGYTLEQAAAVAKRALNATAKATAIAGEWTPRLLSAIAMLGFSRPNTCEPTISTRTIPYNLANYDAPDTCTTLALSASAEHSLGGQELGHGGTDELQLSNLAMRPCYIASTDWSFSDARGHFLFGSVVSPSQWNVSQYTKPQSPGAPINGWTAVPHICMTPAGFAAAVARYWRGTMCYRFSVVSSPYHKGRLRIYYDPYPGAFTATPHMNVVNSVVIDLAKESTVTVEVPWQNVRDVAKCYQPHDAVQLSHTDLAAFQALAATTSTAMCNGIIVCEVLSPLVGLTTDALVSVMVEVWAKDLVLYSPSKQPAGHRPLAMDQSATPYTPQSYDVTGGDAIVSLRQLIKRYDVEFETIMPSPPLLSGQNAAAMQFVAPVYLPIPGFPALDAGGVPSVLHTDVSGDAGEAFSYTRLGFHTYVASAFSMVRGSVRWKVTYSNRNTSNIAWSAASLGRYDSRLSATSSTRITSILSRPSNLSTGALLSTRAKNLQLFRPCDVGAQLALDTTPTGSLDVEFPFVHHLRAINPRAPIFPSTSVAVEDDDYHGNAAFCMETQLSTSLTDTNMGCTLEIYTAAGEDYNVFCFTHAPAFFTSYPTPAPNPAG
jgi:hypothetical protein